MSTSKNFKDVKDAGNHNDCFGSDCFDKTNKTNKIKINYETPKANPFVNSYTSKYYTSKYYKNQN